MFAVTKDRGFQALLIVLSLGGSGSLLSVGSELRGVELLLRLAQFSTFRRSSDLLSQKSPRQSGVE